MTEPLASVEELTARLGYPLEGEERVMAEAALADVSATVRAYGLPWPTRAMAPAVVIAVVLAVAERRVRNPEGYRAESQGGYQYQLPATAPTGVELTPVEIQLIRSQAGMGGLYSVPIERHGGVL
ncbi:hypothetical protein [Streptomyces sp. NRRL S-1813]|uniref:hypothetical protein n=1 Tax=Streptomyces sp. NRRL S-1813 TaxID=1463888 RepID=UPI0004CBD283|nr:hypothetical protein [Streptomyces sp. NRRL S-1813]